jgi:hypothetical protein
MRVLRAATVPLEIAHRGDNGVLHGHSVTAEVWTDQNGCLDAWQSRVMTATGGIEGQLEETIGGRTFEDVAFAVLRMLPEAVRVVVRLPTRGHVVEVSR